MVAKCGFWSAISGAAGLAGDCRGWDWMRAHPDCTLKRTFRDSRAAYSGHCLSETATRSEQPAIHIDFPTQEDDTSEQKGQRGDCRFGVRGGVHSDLSGASECEYVRDLPAERGEAEQGRRFVWHRRAIRRVRRGAGRSEG